jgi:nitroreductase
MRSAYDVIRSKRDTRAYADREIPEEILRRILQAGRMAGSAKHAQPCRFVALTDPAHKRELAACGDFTTHLNAAPVVVAVVLVPPGDQFDPIRATAFDAGRAAQNIMLAAWSEGIASCPVTMHRGDGAARVLGLPEGYSVTWVITLGYPAQAAPQRESRPRLPLSDYVFRERWGTPASFAE